MREIYQYIIKCGGGGGEIIVTYMLKAGYYDDEMLYYLNIYLDKLHNTAKNQCFDIYETDPSKIRWSKLPESWKSGPIAKDIHVHDTTASELPLPTIYHINYMANLYKHIDDHAVKEKIEMIIQYIMHPKYQKFRGIYGASWFYNKAYYAPSPGISLPLYEDKKIEGYIDTLEMMSLFPTAAGTQWFRNCIELLEQYKTKQGTYILPDNCFYSTFARPADTTTVYNAYISKNANIKRNEKRSFTVELLSTFYVLMMKKRMNTIDIK